jgi:Ribulose-phosphate 3 epimerase family
MTSTARAARIAPWHTRFPQRLAGSVYAVPPSERPPTATALDEAGLDVHVDLMAAGEGLPAGVGLHELRAIAAVVSGERIGVQLIGSADFVDAVLPEVLATRPGKVFLPWSAFTERLVGAVRAAGSSPWIALWTEWDGRGAPPWQARPDGALVMLIEPGTSGACQLDRLPVVTACVSALPVIVDGGVTEDVVPLLITAGVESIVVGRALLAPSKGSAT